ncbi:V-type ATP synthase subunit C [Methanosphaerula palustris]|uniref:A-type ATP synthase subunit C n=1 Tax=Methanosphaerula palustris (strain ATCC BAA-1556 / DSM 19958 / E1-9c) TaxID=521011 RepID=B8GHH7_METPE|nr:V-type ATP synthase subunit C [Methanosphaerula palustris]ACL16582.1 H(+)-transporting two-sector ATPase [Methanosphaerula palustris E1-9c]
MAGISHPGAYIYVCTRLQIRKGRLIPEDQYERMLQMSSSQIIRMIGEGNYRAQVLQFPGGALNANQIEQALTDNLALSFQKVLDLAPGMLGLLTSRYLARWDIVNVMLVLHGKEHRISDQRILSELIPAGELDRSFLESLIGQESIDRIVPMLEDWELYPVLSQWYMQKEGAGRFARLENRLYKQYYVNLLHALRNDPQTDYVFTRYIRLEIDLVNLRNIFRLRSGGVTHDLDHYLIPGGTVDLTTLNTLYGIEEKGAFVEEIRRTGIFPLIIRGLQEINREKTVDSEMVGEMLWLRWQQRRTPIHEVEMAVTRARLDQMDRLAIRHPFSVLPVLSYLERKKYEVFNLRAIIRGKEYRLQNDLIRRYLVI